MLNAEQMTKVIELEYTRGVDLLAKRRDAKLAAVNVLADIPPKAAVVGPEPTKRAKPQKKQERSNGGKQRGFADTIRQWVGNGSPKEFHANDCADALKTDRNLTSIELSRLAKIGDVRLVRTEYNPKRRNIYGKIK